MFEPSERDGSGASFIVTSTERGAVIAARIFTVIVTVFVFPQLRIVCARTLANAPLEQRHYGDDGGDYSAGHL